MTWEICMCDVSQGHMMQIEKLGESRADPAENTCKIEKRVINYACNKHSVVWKYSETISLLDFLAKPYDGLISDVTHSRICSKGHSPDSGQINHRTVRRIQNRPN